MKGNGLTLLGDAIEIGQKAPDFEVVANDLSIVRFSSFCGKVCIISSVPSLDTPVCDTMTRRFNEQAAFVAGFHLYTVVIAIKGHAADKPVDCGIIVFIDDV